MLFARLLETRRAADATPSMVEGAGVSAVVHGLLIGGWLFLHSGTKNLEPTPGETFTPVQWLVPKDRLPALRPQRETVTWTSLSSGAGSGFAEAPALESRVERPLDVVMPKGNADETDVAPVADADQQPIALGDSIMTEFMVDSAAVRYENGAAPAYPESMLRRRIEGIVIVQYVVDTLGHADTLTFRVLSATHADFARAVKQTLPRMRFRPAIMANRLVPQLVQQPFAFKIQDTTTVRSRPPIGDRGNSSRQR